ncbi:MAG TPA: hypothetical protein VFL80_03860 [Thermoanaerobaculia bacterium]|nr:hypothetical protein [Thermoanaerobaculia bacterium]
MWVYDGEEWIQEGNPDNGKKPEASLPRREEFLVPELQVIEHVPSTVNRNTNTNLPPFSRP